MSDINPTRRTDEPPAHDGAPLAGWPTVITAEEAVALQKALKQLQTALDAVVRERDEARAENERLRATVQWYGDRACALSREDNRYPFSDLFADAGALARETLEAKP